MSKEAITKVVQRAISDAGFRRQLSTDPTGALRGFDLSADETAALRAGDAGRLSALGVDQRMSKAFALGGVAMGATRQAGTDLSASGLNANANSGLSSGVNSGLNSGPNSGLSGAPNAFNSGGANAFSNADIVGGADASGNALVSGDDSNAALIDDGTSAGRTIIPTEPGANISADTDATSGMSDAYIDDSETYLTKVGYDPDAAATAHADPRDATWSGDDIAGPSSDSASAAEGAADQTDGPSLTP